MRWAVLVFKGVRMASMPPLPERDVRGTLLALMCICYLPSDSVRCSTTPPRQRVALHAGAHGVLSHVPRQAPEVQLLLVQEPW